VGKFGHSFPFQSGFILGAQSNRLFLHWASSEENGEQNRAATSTHAAHGGEV